MLVIIIRTVFLYAIITFGLRIMGKRQLGELQPAEFVVTMLISNIATLPIEDSNLPFLVGVVPILTLICFEIFISTISLKHISFRNVISGTPKIIIANGEIDQQEMKNLRLSLDDLMGQLRVSGVFDIRDVSYAIVETTGKLSVLEKFSALEVTNEAIGITSDTQHHSPPTVIINDGAVNTVGLEFCNLEEQWLLATLKKNSCKLKDVFLMTCNKQKDYHIILKKL